MKRCTVVCLVASHNVGVTRTPLPSPSPPPPAAGPAEGPDSAPGVVLPEDFGRPDRPQALQYTAPTLDAAPGSTGVTTSSGPGGTGVTTGGVQNRNDLCACGSGRKFKRCHGDPRNA